MSERFQLDRERLAALAAEHRDAYRSARPFPHVVIDDFLDEALLDAVLGEFPSPDREEWLRFEGEHEHKLASTDALRFGAATQALLAELNSASAIDFLEELTGIAGLVPDPHFIGGGLHQIVQGGHLDVHADFNRHPLTDLERRLNLLIYLNRDWSADYGGALELWNLDMTAAEARILPLFNRCVVFNTTSDSYHGHPEPLACPPDRTRKSLALYYYSKPTVEDRPGAAHNTLFQRRPGDPAQPPAAAMHDRGSWRAGVRRIAPPIVLDAARAMRARARGSARAPAPPAARPGRANREPASNGDGGGEPPRPDGLNVSALYAWCLANGVQQRPQYLWPLLLGTSVARLLQVPAVSALEFGVAGGNGLLALERAAAAAQRLTGVEVAIFGFDSGTGMPEPVDERDLPWLIEPGIFRMDVDALRARLDNAQLVLGPVATTARAWLAAEHPPVGFASFDLDYYSSTMEAFAVLSGAADRLLPRVPCYFDDIFGYGWSELTGERAAIADFNAAHAQRKIAQIPGLRFELPPAEFTKPWHEQLYLLHAFDHPRYGERKGRLAAGWHEAHRLAPA